MSPQCLTILTLLLIAYSDEIETAVDKLLQSQNQRTGKRARRRRAGKGLLAGVKCVLTFKLGGGGGGGESDANTTALEQISERLAALVEACGGELLDSAALYKGAHIRRTFGSASAGSPPCVVLLAPAPVHTAKYCLALAAHVPCLHYTWLLHAVASGSLPAYQAYALPVGKLPVASLPNVDNKNHNSNDDDDDDDDMPSQGMPSPWPMVVRWPALLTQRDLEPLSRERAFARQRIEVTGDESFQKAMLAVLNEAGAKTETVLFKAESASRPMAVLSDLALVDSVAERAALYDIPVVSLDWVTNKQTNIRFNFPHVIIFYTNIFTTSCSIRWHTTKFNRSACQCITTISDGQR
jgi:hypothetical protein